MFLTCVLNGGLGNQLFQLGSLYYFSKQKKCNILLDPEIIQNYLKHFWNRETYWDTVFINFRKF